MPHAYDIVNCSGKLRSNINRYTHQLECTWMLRVTVCLNIEHKHRPRTCNYVTVHSVHVCVAL